MARCENMLCTFNVVRNAFVGLDFTESTSYDIIFISNDISGLDARKFTQILRNVGAPMDIVLITNAFDSCTLQDANKDGFKYMLKRKFTQIDVCDIVLSSMNGGIC